MATNFYFNNFSSTSEQSLIENLVIESIKQYGVDNYYIPRKIVGANTTFREQTFSEFGEAVLMEMYVKNLDGFDGEGEFLSQFGVEVREQITFSVAVRTYEQEAAHILKRDRPVESDLIWFPFTGALYTIKFVNKKPVFYQMGALQFYDVVCELFEYSNEVFNTGLSFIDKVYNSFLITTTPYIIATEDGQPLFFEDGTAMLEESYDLDLLDEAAQNTLFETQALDFLDFSQGDPFSETQRRA